MPNKVTNTANYQAIADAIRAKNGSTDKYTPAQMAEAIRAIEATDTEDLAAIILRTNTSVAIPNGVTEIPENAFDSHPHLRSVSNTSAIEHIKDYGFAATLISEIDLLNCTVMDVATFYKCPYLKTVNAPKLKSAYDTSTFRGCSALQSANFPELEDAASYMFEGCNSLTSAYTPKATSVSDHMFYGCGKLKTVNVDAVRLVYDNAFYNCVSLTKVEMPSCTNMYDSVFGGCTALESISATKCESIGNSVFTSCKALKSIYLPSCTRIGYSPFSFCKSLTKAELPACTTFGSNTFSSLSALTAVDIQSCTATTSGMFSNSGVKTLVIGAVTANNVGSLPTDCTVYAPAASVDSIKAMSEWSKYTILPIEDNIDTLKGVFGDGWTYLAATTTA